MHQHLSKISNGFKKNENGFLQNGVIGEKAQHPGNQPGVVKQKKAFTWICKKWIQETDQERLLLILGCFQHQIQGGNEEGLNLIKNQIF